MHVSRRTEVAAPVESVHESWTSPVFLEEVAEATSTGKHASAVEPIGQQVRTRIERFLPTDELPDVARSFVGRELHIVETITWEAPDPDGSRRGVLELTVAGAPLTVKGTIVLRPRGAQTTVELEGTLKANVPLIGGRIEKAASEPLMNGLDKELALLARHATD